MKLYLFLFPIPVKFPPIGKLYYVGKTYDYSAIYRQIFSEMATIDNVRNGLIDKILSKEQKTMLEMRESDIKDGKVIAQETMDKINLE